jgi:hypothetical protein
MIYDYYFDAMETTLAESQDPQDESFFEDGKRITWQYPRQTSNFQPLKLYLSMLHLSLALECDSTQTWRYTKQPSPTSDSTSRWTTTPMI